MVPEMVLKEPCSQCANFIDDDIPAVCWTCLSQEGYPEFRSREETHGMEMFDSREWLGTYVTPEGEVPVYEDPATWKPSTAVKQVGGSHYQMPIEPVEFIVKNNIPYREANVIKYVVRHARKNGREDILKAIHYLEMILEDYPS